MLPDIVTVALPALWMPYTVCMLAAVLQMELACMLLAVVVLPMVLPLIVVVPAVAVFTIPKKLVANAAALAAVIAPMVLL